MNVCAENKAGTCVVHNPNLNSLEYDVLYHLGLSTRTDDLITTFGDVKFVCMGGSASRMKRLAELLAVEAGCQEKVQNLAAQVDRYALYKVKSVLCVSHGMGVPSLCILLHELMKLVHYARCKDVTFIRLGTCGGVGVEPGTLIISNACMDMLFRPVHELKILGKTVQRPTKLDQDLVKELQDVAQSSQLGCQVVVGSTMCANDFYEEQARLDGAVCTFTKEEKLNFLKKAYDQGVRNIEMECTGFAAHCHLAGIRAGVVCVALLDRMLSDQLAITPEQYAEFQELPCKFVIAFLRKRGVF